MAFEEFLSVISFWQVAVTVASSMLTLCAGYTLSYTSPALPSMKDDKVTDFHVSEQAGSWVGGIMPLVGIGGCLSAIPLVVFLGRRLTSILTVIPFVVGWIVISCATSIAMVLVGRALTGLAVGMCTLSCPVLLGESLHPLVRGSLGLFPRLFGTLGMFVCYSAGYKANWIQLAILGGALCVPYFVFLLFVPESPRWFLIRGKEDKAKKSLKRLRRDDFDVDGELSEMAKVAAVSSGAYRNICDRNNIKPVFLCLSLMFFQQFSGANAIVFYTVSIFKDSGSSLDAHLCTIVIGAVNFTATVVAMFFIDRLGRKILLYVSSVGCAITLSILSLFFHLKARDADLSSFSWVPLTSLIIFTSSYSFGLGAVPWLMLAEILPSRIRAPGVSLAATANWTGVFIITKTFSDLVGLIGSAGTFLFYAICCICGLIFFIFMLPETKNKSLEQIEAELRGEKSEKSEKQ